MKKPQILRKAATLKDVASAAGVSIAAASYAINGGGTISAEARLRIQGVADQMGYRPVMMARGLKTGRSTTIGLVVRDLNNPYYPALAQSFVRAAKAHGYAVLLVDIAGDEINEAEAIRMLEEHGVAGTVWCQTITQGGSYRVPTVVIGPPTTSFDSVMADDIRGGQLIARHLLEREHRRFGLVVGASVPKKNNHRRTAFLEEVKEKASVVWEASMPFGDDIPEDIVALIAKRDVTAIVCGNDLVAIGVLRTARKLGIKVPEELSVVGFDDIPWACIVTPTLTTIRQFVTEMAGAALQLLFDRIKEPTRPLRHLTVDVALIERESSSLAP